MTTTPAPLEAPPVALPGNPFTLGVASGDPTADSVILWTRLAPDPLAGGGMPENSIPVVWEVAASPDFLQLLQTGVAQAVAVHGHSLHITVPDLEADAVYWYRFRAGDYVGPIGRTRTLPANGAAVGQFNFAFSSCQRFEDAHFTAWHTVAGLDLNLVVFLGDYIYETTPRAAPIAGRGFEAQEASDLTGYRNRYARYKLDHNLQAAHAAHPFVVVWDDHEVSNNYGPLGADPAADLRRAAAYQAWWENMPVRLPAPSGPVMPIHRTIRVGDLLQLWLLDTRQYRSSEPTCTETLDNPALADAPLVVACEDVLSPERTMLGEQQLEWLLSGLQSASAGWNVVAQQVLMASTGSIDGLPGPLALTDKWGGFQWEREQIMTTLSGAGTPNPVILTGDFHAAGVGHLGVGTGNNDTVAVEFMAPPISSRFSIRRAALAEVLPRLASIDYLEPFRGFASCNVTAESWETTYWRVADVADPDSSVNPDSTWVVKAGESVAKRG